MPPCSSTDGRYTEQARHEVPDLERVTYEQTYRDVLAERCRALGIARLGFEARALTVAGHGKLEEACGCRASLVAVDGAVEDLRTTKDPEEVALLCSGRRPPPTPRSTRCSTYWRVGMTEQRVALRARAPAA